MPVIIPLRTDLTHYTFQIVLDGAEYTLELRWNERELAWYLNVQTAAKVPVLDSIKVVVNWQLGARSANAERPRGFFFAFDTSGSGIDPAINELGDRVVLVYFTAADVATIKAG